MAATGTGAADPLPEGGYEQSTAEDFVSGKVEVSAQYGEWQYQVNQGGLSSEDNEFPPIELGSDVETGDRIIDNEGQQVEGIVSSGDTDSYTFQAPIEYIGVYPEPDGQRALEFWPLQISVTRSAAASSHKLKAYNQNFEYGIEFIDADTKITQNYWSGGIQSGLTKNEYDTSGNEITASANFAVPTGKYITVKFYPGEEA
ncbi:hypothetical protein [Halorhabdus sp. BNX81]|uniref:hypothetical protein n=1 Tax=Halorhabdus sp. BNX81 TaxID=2980181 RepID=UPI0023DD4966|nr:hypothetical protein [Halorhabdus sp. BNX81]